MKIYINGRFLTQQITGVQKFCYEITKELVKKSSLDIVVLIPNNTKINKSYLINFKIKRIGLFSGHLWEQISLPYFLYKNGFPLIYCKKQNWIPTYFYFLEVV